MSLIPTSNLQILAILNHKRKCLWYLGVWYTRKIWMNVILLKEIQSWGLWKLLSYICLVHCWEPFRSEFKRNYKEAVQINSKTKDSPLESRGFSQWGEIILIGKELAVQYTIPMWLSVLCDLHKSKSIFEHTSVTITVSNGDHSPT